MTSEHAYPIRFSWILLLVALMILLGSAARADVWPFGTSPSHTPLLASAAAASVASSAESGAETRALRLGLAREGAHGRTAARQRRAWARPKVLLAALGSPPVVPSTTSSATPAVSRSEADWYAIADCESDGVWQINSGNGYWGGLQFTPSTWFAYGGGPFDGTGPFPYSAAQQIAVAERVLAAQGPSAWPNCFRWA